VYSSALGHSNFEICTLKPTSSQLFALKNELYTANWTWNRKSKYDENGDTFFTLVTDSDGVSLNTLFDAVTIRHLGPDLVMKLPSIPYTFKGSLDQLAISRSFSDSLRSFAGCVPAEEGELRERESKIIIG